MRRKHTGGRKRRRGKCLEVSRAWLRGRTKHYARTDINVSTRVKVLKAIIKGTLMALMSFARTRAWQTNQIKRMQGVIHIAIRRCLGYRLRDLRKAGITNEVLRNLAQWEKFDTAVRRASLLWLGHVARMPVEALQKQVLFATASGKAKPKARPKRTPSAKPKGGAIGRGRDTRLAHVGHVCASSVSGI